MRISRYPAALWCAVSSIAEAQVPALAQTATRPVPLTDPASWITAEDYPPDAMRAHIEGRVGLTLNVDASGMVSGCTVTSLSGSTSLDERACSVFSARARFPPTLDTTLRRYDTRVRWTLPTSDILSTRLVNMTPVEIAVSTQVGDGGAELSVGSDGIVTACNPLPQPYKNVLGPPDICRSYPVGVRYGPPTVRNGRPVRRRVRVRITIESTPLAGN